jgi:hypothetical protein
MLKICIFVNMLCRNVLPAEVDHLFKYLNFFWVATQRLVGFDIVADIGHLIKVRLRGPNGLYTFSS